MPEGDTIFRSARTLNRCFVATAARYPIRCTPVVEETIRRMAMPEGDTIFRAARTLNRRFVATAAGYPLCCTPVVEDYDPEDGDA